MTPVNRMQAAEAREQIERGMIPPTQLPDYAVALKPGWDFIPDLAKADPVNGGIWRTCHFDPRGFYADPSSAPLPMLHTALSRDELCARLWRLARMYPDDAAYRDTPAEDPFMPAEGNGLGTRDTLFRPLFGHPLRDTADFQRWVLDEHPELGELLLHKRFKEAFELYPDLLNLPWPSSCRRRWVKLGGGDFLPPVIALALVAEFQRLAQNVTAQIHLSFSDDGTPLTIKSLKKAMKKALKKKKKKKHTKAAAPELTDSRVPHLLAMAPFQTHALLPLADVLKQGDAAEGVRHTWRAQGSLHHAFDTFGDDLVDHLTGQAPDSPTALLAENGLVHPDRAADRKAKKGSLATRRDYAVTYWGLNWLEHAYLGLFQLAQAAEDYNRQYRTDGPRLNQRGDHEHRGLRQAVARLARFWVETAHPAAFRRLAIAYAKMLQKKGGAERRMPPDHPEVERIFDESFLVDIDEAAIRKVFDARTQTPARGLPGITAQYRPALWYEQSSNDIGFWIGRELEARYGQSRILEDRSSRVPLSAVLGQGGKVVGAAQVRALASDIRGDIDRLAHLEPTLEARVNQNLAMTIGEFSTDPMLSFLRRKEFLLPI